MLMTKNSENDGGEGLGNAVYAARATPFSEIFTPILRQNIKKSLILINFF